jgi:ketosteroid isomerase-like protein
MGSGHPERNVQAVEAYFESIDHGQEVVASRREAEWIERRERQTAELLHPDFEISFTARDGTNETYAGADSFAQAGSSWLQPWREYRTHLEEAIAVGDQVVVVSRAWALPSEGERAIESLITFLWTFRDGRVIRMEHFRTREEALQAAETAA